MRASSACRASSNDIKGARGAVLMGCQSQY